MRLSWEEIARMTGAAAPSGKNLPLWVEGYSIDSRTIRAGEVFFAVRGTRDGHEFADAALAAGAAGAVVARGLVRQRDRVLFVPDPQTALQQLARRAREKWRGRVVAVTGSNGKTTTKEIVATLLGTRYRVAKSEGNLNNELGLPLSILRLDDAAEVGVLEMGMNHPGEIRALAAIAQPDVGVVTNVSAAHLAFFSSVDEIALAKRELIESLKPDGVAVLNADDDRVRGFAAVHSGRVVTYGLENEAEVRAVEVESLATAGTLFRVDGVAGDFRTPLVGRHNLYNTLAGMAAAVAVGIQLESLREAVAGLQPGRMRGETLEVGGARVINDCYNSNPRAAEAMLEMLAAQPARRRIAVLGEMLELGESTEELHRQVGRKSAELGLDLLVGVRGSARFMVEAAGRAAVFFENPEEAGEYLRATVQAEDVVLFKGSRGVRLERALERLRAASNRDREGADGPEQPPESAPSRSRFGAGENS
jgi:UDP-N-acetylmuramoyl-tripeptide--D-alanyl-D-alanine ligase